jgi:hypothetical protein
MDGVICNENDGTEETALKITELTCRHGAPNRVLSDQGKLSGGFIE